MNVRTRPVVTAGFRGDGLAEEVVGLLQAVRRALRDEYERQARGTALAESHHYLPLLHEVAELPGVTVNELARRTRMPKSRVSVLVARLVERGIVRRDTDEHDTRLVHLRITPEGQRRACSWRATHHRALLRTLEPLSDEQLATIVDGLELLLSALEPHRKRMS